MDTEAGLAFAYTKDEETDPTFLFFLDGMKETKFWIGKIELNNDK